MLIQLFHKYDLFTRSKQFVIMFRIIKRFHEMKDDNNNKKKVIVQKTTLISYTI